MASRQNREAKVGTINSSAQRKRPNVKQQSNQVVCRAYSALLAGRPNGTVKGTLDMRHRFGQTALAPLT
jgi:hypothetical protein